MAKALTMDSSFNISMNEKYKGKSCEPCKRFEAWNRRGAHENRQNWLNFKKGNNSFYRLAPMNGGHNKKLFESFSR